MSISRATFNNIPDDVFREHIMPMSSRTESFDIELEKIRRNELKYLQELFKKLNEDFPYWESDDAHVWSDNDDEDDDENWYGQHGFVAYIDCYNDDEDCDPYWIPGCPNVNIMWRKECLCCGGPAARGQFRCEHDVVASEDLEYIINKMQQALLKPHLHFFKSKSEVRVARYLSELKEKKPLGLIAAAGKNIWSIFGTL